MHAPEQAQAVPEIVGRSDSSHAADIPDRLFSAERRAALSVGQGNGDWPGKAFQSSDKVAQRLTGGRSDITLAAVWVVLTCWGTLSGDQRGRPDAAPYP